MAKTLNERMTVEFEGDFVVFLIGMKINRLWKIHKWLPVAAAMPKMLKELSLNPESGSWVSTYRRHSSGNNPILEII